MRKKLISVLLVAALVLGLIPLISTAEDEGQAVRGEYIYNLSSDPDTGTPPTVDIEPGGFGHPDSNGRIWTDKSVAVNGDHFDVNLKVLAQEYVSSYGTTVTQSIAADVVFVIDMTSSMISNKIDKPNGTQVTRYEALVDAANEAIDIITTTNPNNRITMYGYYGGRQNAANVCEQILPLAHYESTSTADTTVGKYLVYRKANTGNTAYIDSSTTLLKDGQPYTFSVKNGTGTNTQYGIARGVKSLVDDISNEYQQSGKNGDRKPYVIVLTDGASNIGSHNWYSKTTDASGVLTDYSSNTISSSSSNDNNAIISALTVLTASFWRRELQEAYKTYNGKDLGIEWFNIGLDLGEDKEKETGVSLNPESLRDAVADRTTGNAADKVKYHLKNAGNSAVNQIPVYSEHDFIKDYEYIYTQGVEGGYVTFADSYSVLMNAFTTLAEIIKLGSQEYTVPIVNHEGSGETSDMVFTDVIGEGMFVTDITLKPNGKAPVQGIDDNGDGVYEFSGFSTTVTVTKDENSGQQTLVWNLPAPEVAMYTFKDRENVTNGEYNTADPTTLTFGVDFTEDIEEGTTYTNDFEGRTPESILPHTTVTYEIPGDNGYYFDVVKDSAFNFVSSTMRENLDSSETKTDNVTLTSSDVNSYAYTAVNDGTADSSATVTGHLGNNGKVTFDSYRQKMEITVEKKWEDEYGNPITNTTGLPAVSVTLYRKSGPDGAEEEVPDINPITLNRSNDYSETFSDLPIRDENDVRYSYYIREECPEGYYTSYISQSVQARDSILTVKNRELPGEGSLLVKKVWKDSLGATINDTENLSPVTVNLKRNVTKVTPEYYTVTITCTDSNNKTIALDPIQVKPGAVLSYNFRIGLQSQKNAQRATLTKGSDTTAIQCDAPTSENVRVTYNNRNYSYTVWYKQPSAAQTLTVIENTTVDYHINYAFNNGQYLPDTNRFQLVGDYTTTGGSDAGTEYFEGDYKDITLGNDNNWQEMENNLPLTENINGSICTYKYYVEEAVSVPGYTVSYSDNNAEGVTSGILTVTNKEIAKIGPLPETGGKINPNTVRVIGFSAVFFSAAYFFIKEALPKRRKRRRADT